MLPLQHLSFDLLQYAGSRQRIALEGALHAAQPLPRQSRPQEKHRRSRVWTPVAESLPVHSQSNWAQVTISAS